MSNSRYRLPTSPPNAAALFRSLCEPLSTAMIPALVQRVERLRGRVSEIETGRPDTSRTVLILVERSLMLLKRYEGYGRSERGLVIGAVRYLLSERDGVVDATPGVGFRDDAAVMNHVLEELGFQEGFVEEKKS